jgi:hypothetical protein
LVGCRFEAEENRFSIVPGDPYYHTFAELLATPDSAAFFAAYPYAVAPPTDDHPFFFHFFKWQQIPEILQSLGWSWQPFGGSGYLVLIVLLVLVIVLSAGLILLPLFGIGANQRMGKWRSGLQPEASHSAVSGHFPLCSAWPGISARGNSFVAALYPYLGQPAHALPS